MDTVEEQTSTQASEDKVDPPSAENGEELTEGDTDAKKSSPENTDVPVETKQEEGPTDNVEASPVETKSSAEAEESATI